MSAYGSTGKKSSTPESHRGAHSSRVPKALSGKGEAIDADDEDLEDSPPPRQKKDHKPAPAPETGSKKTTALVLFLVVGGFVAAGTCSTVLSKILFQLRAYGDDGIEKNFGKPLFQNTGMFVGMSLCLLVFEINARFFAMKSGAGEKQPLLGGPAPGADWRVYYVVIVPAICDFIATYMMNVGLLWINASVWQMLRGSIVLFSAVIRWIWLGRTIHNYQWFGVVTVMSALGIIGFSCIMNQASVAHVPGELVATEWQKLLGVILVFLAQLVQATQTVVEEHLLHDIRASDMQIVGLEGVWGLGLCVLVAMPVAYYIPVAGLHEDTWDTLAMMRNSSTVFWLFMIYVLVILAYNMMAMKVTMYLDSVTRNVLDTVRTIFIWTLLTVVHYTVADSMGEAWSGWSWMQLFGFLVLITGLFTYNKVFQLPCFDYPSEQPPAPPPKERTPLPMHSPYMSPKI